MKEAEPQTIRLTDYQPPGYRTERVDLHVDIRDGETTVSSTLKVRRIGSAGSLELNGDGLQLDSVSVNGVLLSSNEYEATPDRLLIHDPGAEAEIHIVNRIHPETNTALMGLYKSKTMYCTQCEAEGFRRITYFLDRPDVLSIYTTRISADKAKYPVLLSIGKSKP